MADQNPRPSNPSGTRLDPSSAAEAQRGSRTLGAEPGSEDKVLYERFADLTPTDLDRLALIPAGTELEQGAVYFDLDNPDRGPFKAIGGDAAGSGTRLIAKRETDYEIWNRLVPEDRLVETDPAIERPSREAHGITNQATLNN
jgi:hypothetical protein